MEWRQQTLSKLEWGQSSGNKDSNVGFLSLAKYLILLPHLFSLFPKEVISIVFRTTKEQLILSMI